MKSLIKKETIKKIEEEIRNKTTIPNMLKEKIKKNVFTNMVIAVLMIIYFTFLIMGSEGSEKAVRSIDFNIFSIFLLTLSIYLFEIAYKKDEGSLAMYGIETLVIAIITLFFPYIIFELNGLHKKYYMILSFCIMVYYIIKAICIVSRIKKLHIKQSSDINEIIKKEKRKKIDIVEENNKHKDENKIDNKDNKNKRKNTKMEKTDTKSKTKESNTPKKRGRPRKVEIKND